MTRIKKYSLPIALAVMLLLLGYITRVEHWPFGSQIERIGLMAIGSLYTIRYFRKFKKDALDTIKFILITAYVLTCILMSYKLMGLHYVQWFVIILTFIWTAMEMAGLLLDKFDKLNAVLYSGVGIMILEQLFRMMWWPGGSVLHVFGLLFISTGFVIDAVSQNKARVHSRKNGANVSGKSINLSNTKEDT